MKAVTSALAIVLLMAGGGVHASDDGATPGSVKQLPATCPNLDGASVFSQEPSPVFLGFFGVATAPDSIDNPSGPYGSINGVNSVRNETGKYGSTTGAFSARNPSTTLPPVIVKQGRTVAFLSTNTRVVSSDYPFEVESTALAAIDPFCEFFSTQTTQAFTDQTGAGGYDVSFSGFWWNPGRSGEGILLDFGESGGGDPVLFLAFFTYDPNGNPISLSGSVSYSRNSNAPLTMQIITVRGGKFGPDYDPATVQRIPWGSATLRVVNCDEIEFTYASTLPGYGTGTLTFRRFLLRDSGVSCP